MSERILAPLVPRPDQQAAIDMMSDPNQTAAINASEMATGKTLMAVETAKKRRARTILILGPDHTMHSWEDTFKRQGASHPFLHMHNGNKAGKEAIAKFKAGDTGIYFITRELFRHQNMDWTKDYVDFLIYDECHVLSGQRGKSASWKSLRTLKRGFAMLQSATWFGSNFEGAREIARAAWPELYKGGFNLWRDEWCATEFDAFTFDKKRVVGEKTPGKFAASLPCYVRLTNTLGKPLFKQIYVDLPPKQRKPYEEMELEGVAWLRDNPLVADFPMTKQVRLRQMTLGTCSIREGQRRKWARDDEGNPLLTDDGEREFYTEEYEEVYFEDDTQSVKLEALQKFLADIPDEKVLITTDSTRFAQVAARRLGAFEWTGNNSKKKRHQAKESFIHSDLKYIVAHPMAIGEGTDGLQHVCSIIVRLSRHWSPVIEEQLTGRTNRPGQTKQPVIVDIMARDTLDDPQAETMLVKELKMRQSVVASLS